MADTVNLPSRSSGFPPLQEVSVDGTTIAGDGTSRDPLRALGPPLQEVATDGTTITGNGTVGSPLQAVGGGGGSGRLVLGVDDSNVLSHASGPYLALDLGFAHASLFGVACLVQNQAPVIQGLLAQVNGYVAIIRNNGPETLYINDEDAGADPANQILTPKNLQWVIFPGLSAFLYYDTTLSKWIGVAIPIPISI